LADRPTVQPWQERGHCAGAGPDLMFPEANDMAGVLAAKAVCEGCPVTASCLTYALDTPERFGVWGGLTEYARRKLRKARKAHQPAATGPPRRRDPTRPPPRRAPSRRPSAA
jgi:WhiB family redox-sensing transcriptional regulator